MTATHYSGALCTPYVLILFTHQTYRCCIFLHAPLFTRVWRPVFSASSTGVIIYMIMDIRVLDSGHEYGHGTADCYSVIRTQWCVPKYLDVHCSPGSIFLACGPHSWQVSIFFSFLGSMDILVHARGFYPSTLIPGSVFAASEPAIVITFRSVLCAITVGQVEREKK